MKTRWVENRGLLNNWQIIFIPTRTEETRVEFYSVHGQMNDEGFVSVKLTELQAFGNKQIFHEGNDVDLKGAESREGSIDYCLMMFGVPARSVQLTREQLDYCYDQTVKHIEKTGDAVNSVFLTQDFVKQGMLAITKMCLGEATLHYVNGRTILEEGKVEFSIWKKKLEEMA